MSSLARRGWLGGPRTGLPEEQRRRQRHHSACSPSLLPSLGRGRIRTRTSATDSVPLSRVPQKGEGQERPSEKLAHQPWQNFARALHSAACLHGGVAVTLALFTLTETKFARERGNLHDESSYSPVGLSRPLRDCATELEDCGRTLQDGGKDAPEEGAGGNDSGARECEGPPD